MLVDPTRSQNMTVIGRRSAPAGDDAGAGLDGLAAVSAVPRAAIALTPSRCPRRRDSWLHQLVECDWQVAHPFARGVEHGVGDCGADSCNANLADASAA